jgi:hypothetical protein
VSAPVVVVLDAPAPLAGTAYPEPDTDWPALHARGFRLVVRLHPAAYDPAPLAAADFELEDLFGGRRPLDETRETRVVWEAAGAAAAAVARGDGVLVHCVGGTGRTGTVLACALRRLGWSAEDAVAAVRAARPRWPESPWQEEVARGKPAGR